MIVTLVLMQIILKVLPAIALAPESFSKPVTEGAGDVGKNNSVLPHTSPLVGKFTVVYHIGRMARDFP